MMDSKTPFEVIKSLLRDDTQLSLFQINQKLGF